MWSEIGRIFAAANTAAAGGQTTTSNISTHTILHNHTANRTTWNTATLNTQTPSTTTSLHTHNHHHPSQRHPYQHHSQTSTPIAYRCVDGITTITTPPCSPPGPVTPDPQSSLGMSLPSLLFPAQSPRFHFSHHTRMHCASKLHHHCSARLSFPHPPPTMITDIILTTLPTPAPQPCSKHSQEHSGTTSPRSPSQQPRHPRHSYRARLVLGAS